MGAGFGAGFFFTVFFVAGVAFFIPFFLRAGAPRLAFFATFDLPIGSTKIMPQGLRRNGSRQGQFET
jgi:hypothetical protein